MPRRHNHVHADGSRLSSSRPTSSRDAKRSGVQRNRAFDSMSLDAGESLYDRNASPSSWTGLENSLLNSGMPAFDADRTCRLRERIREGSPEYSGSLSYHVDLHRHSVSYYQGDSFRDLSINSSGYDLDADGSSRHEFYMPPSTEFSGSTQGRPSIVSGGGESYGYSPPPKQFHMRASTDAGSSSHRSSFLG